MEGLPDTPFLEYATPAVPVAYVCMYVAFTSVDGFLSILSASV